MKKLNDSTSPNANGVSLGRYETFGEFQLLLRAGDVLIPKLDFVEPLKLECQHFIECIRTGQRPITDGYDGLRVVEVLEAAQRSLSQNSASLSIKHRVQHATHSLTSGGHAQ